VNIRSLKAVLPRHPLLVILVVVLVAAIAYNVKHARPTYAESATFVFTVPAAAANPSSEASLLVSGDVMAQSLMSPSSQSSIRAAGGTAVYNIALVNLGDQEYPEYQFPFATLTAQATSADAINRTFTVTLDLLNRLLATRQTQVGAPSGSWISVDIVGATGPVVQAGSKKRSLGALALLAATVIFMISNILDWRGKRLPALPTRWRRKYPAMSANDRQRYPIQDQTTTAARARSATRSARHRTPRDR
jgi:hypothetical protein